MSKYVLEAINLTKTFKSEPALSNVGIKLERGRIYGFVGNNGAGKTTLMRIVSGLIRPTSGKISLFGMEDEKGLRQSRARMGVLVEQPVFYPYMTVRQNLIAQSTARGKVDKRQIDELLETVGLSRSGKKKMLKDFSTGMKQRYGIAFALLGEPEFLVLDEPFNGLDVDGMDEMTALLKGICTEKGTTVLISSHMLARLHQFATDYIFINYGKIVEEITAGELGARCVGKDLEEYFRKLVRTNVLFKGGSEDA